MKKALWIGAAILGLVAAGWSGLWYMGKGQIGSRLDQETARMEASGWKVLWGEREVSGFPFGYDVALTDVIATSEQTGLLVRLGDITAQADGSNPDRIVTVLPPKIELTMPVSEARRLADPNLPRAVQITIDSDDMVMAVEGLDPLERIVEVFASKLTVTANQEDMAYRLGLEADGMAATLKAGPGKHQLIFRADRAATLLANAADPLDPVLTYDYQDMSMTADIAARSPQHFVQQMAANVTDLLSGTFIAGSQTMTMTVAGDVPGDENRSILSYKAGASTALFGLSEGRVSYQGDDTLIEASVKTKNQSSPTQDMSAKAAYYQRQIDVPLPMMGSDPQQSKVRVSVAGVNPDEAVWQMLDKNGVLDRSAGQVDLDVITTLRWVRDGAGGVPLEFSNITLQEFALDALGAKARASGDIEILQPIRLPHGTLDVEISGAQLVLRTLKEAGLLPEGTRRMAEAMLQVYAKPSEAEDTWTTDITFDFNGVSVNGFTIGQ